MPARTWLALDAETIPNPLAEAWLPEPAAPGNYKDAEKIAAAKAEKRARDREKMSLDPWASRPCVISLQTELDREPVVYICECDADLADALCDVARRRHVSNGETRPILGYNVRRFDWPHFTHHARRLSLDWPRLDLRRWNSFDVLDLYDLFDDDTEHVISRSLKSACRVYGVALPDDDIDGKDVATLLAEGRVDDIVRHCTLDVQRVVALARRLRVIQEVAS